MEAKVAAVQITLPELAEGERYAGLILDENGKPAHHVVLLPRTTIATWKKALEWAKKQGGELPSRREQSLLFANCKTEFEERWYWSGEQHADASGCAWGQSFGDGLQFWGGSTRYHARAVRRVSIQ